MLLPLFYERAVAVSGGSFTCTAWLLPIPPPVATLVQVCWGMAGVVFYHLWKQAGEVREADLVGTQPSNSLEHPADILGFSRTAVLRS